jgi:hypothetical protein
MKTPAKKKRARRKTTTSRGAVKDRRVREIIDLISTENWVPGTPHELAKRWKVPPESVYQMRAEALRVIRLSMGTADKEEMRDLVMLRLNDVYRMAMLNNDAKGATSALKLASQLTGSLVHRHQISAVEQVREELAGKTDDELKQELKVLEIKAVG